MRRRLAVLAAIAALAFVGHEIIVSGAPPAVDQTFQLDCHQVDQTITCSGQVATTLTGSTTTTVEPSTSTTESPSTTTSSLPSTSTTTTATSTSTTANSVPTSTTTSIPTTSESYVIGASEATLRLAAPTSPATMTVAQLAAASGNITGPTVIRGGTYSGKVTISGSDVVITGVTFTSNQSDAIRITGMASRIRLYRNTFSNVGSNAGAGSFGIIKVDPHPSVTDNAASQRVPIERRLTIDENTFTNPHNAVMWVNHGNRKIRFSHNTITGPAFTPTGDTESEAIKFGWNDGQNDDATGSVFAFNTIANSYDGRPYTVGFKQSGWQVVGNILARRTELRSANYIRFIGNVIADGDLHGGGVGHTVAKNFIRTITDHDSFGPVSMTSTNGGGFYVVWKNGTFTGNTIINDAPGDGYGVVLFHSQMSGVTERPNGNTFTDNLFVTKIAAGKNGTGVIFRNNNDLAVTIEQQMAQNTWVNNRYASTATPIKGIPPGSTQVAVPPSTVPTTVVLTASELPGTV